MFARIRQRATPKFDAPFLEKVEADLPMQEVVNFCQWLERKPKIDIEALSLADFVSMQLTHIAKRYDHSLAELQVFREIAQKLHDSEIGKRPAKDFFDLESTDRSLVAESTAIIKHKNDTEANNDSMLLLSGLFADVSTAIALVQVLRAYRLDQVSVAELGRYGFPHTAIRHIPHRLEVSESLHPGYSNRVIPDPMLYTLADFLLFLYTRSPNVVSLLLDRLNGSSVGPKRLNTLLHAVVIYLQKHNVKLADQCDDTWES